MRNRDRQSHTSSKMFRFETIDLGKCRGENFLLVGFVEFKPSDNEDYDPNTDADNYGVSLVRTGPSPLVDNVQIVRMDTAHGHPHMDLVYLPPDTGESQKVWLEEGYSYSRMKGYISTNWEIFADRYSQYNE